MNELPVYEDRPEVPGHDFWLLREDKQSYKAYMPFVSRRDALVQIPDGTLETLSTGLQWTPLINPSNRAAWPGYGLNTFGPTIINHDGGATWAQVLRGWAQIFQSGPSTLRIPMGIIYVGPGKIAAEPRTIKAGDGSRLHFKDQDTAPVPHQHILLVNRDPFVANLKTLADWGDKAATGEYFILYLGI